MARPNVPGVMQVRLETRWDDIEAPPMLLANQLITQVFQGNVVLTFGQVAPPPLVGTPEEQAAAAEKVSSVPIRTLARLVIPFGPFEEMAEAFQTALSAIKAQREAEGSNAPEADPPTADD